MNPKIYKIENAWRDGSRTPITRTGNEIMYFDSYEEADKFRKAWANESSEVIEVTIITP